MDLKNLKGKKNILTAAITTVAIAAAGMFGANLITDDNSVPVKCHYEIKEISSMSSEMELTIPYDEHPTAVFYAVMLDDNVIGVSPFGEDFGVASANLVFSDPSKLTVNVLNGPMKVIGTGVPDKNGKITIKFLKDEVINDEE